MFGSGMVLGSGYRGITILMKNVRAYSRVTLDGIKRHNKEWAKKVVAEDKYYFKNLNQGQWPIAMYIGCSDSRLAIERFTGTDPGDLFITRNVANQVKTDDVGLRAYLSYGIRALNIKNVIVCGHKSCGGVAGALSGQVPSDSVRQWVQPIRDLYEEHKDYLDSIDSDEKKHEALEKLNVVRQIRNLRELGVIKENPEVDLYAWYINISTGLIEELPTENSAPS